MTTTIQLKGTTFNDFTSNSGPGTNAAITIDLSKDAIWHGGFHALGHFGIDGFTIDGKLGATFMNTHSDAIYNGGSSDVDVAVAGDGTFTVASGATLTFDKAVGTGQVVTLAEQATWGTLQLNDPKAFAGAVVMQTGVIDFAGLPKVDSYSFANDMLTLYGSGKNVIDTLRLSSAAPIAVERTSGGIMAYSASLTFLNAQGTALPVHV